MTLLRQLAVKLSTRMVEYASPSRKEFAAGLAREIEFISSDWRALAWSLGSVWFLLRPGKPALRSLDDVPAAAGKFARERSGRVLPACFACAFAAIWFAISLRSDFIDYTLSQKYFHSWPLAPIGHIISLAGMIGLAIRAWKYHRLTLPPPTEPRASAVYYRAELLRFIDLESGPATVACFAAMLGGCVLADFSLRGPAHFIATMVGFTCQGFIFPVVLVAIYRIRFRITVRELDTLLAEDLESRQP